MYLRRIALILALAAMPAFADVQSDEFIGKTDLPPQVPYLNTREDFFMGNGYAGAGGSGDGTWNFLVGPDYTCPNYLKREEIRMVVDGTEQALTMDEHRARETGIFYGICTNGDLKVTLIDYTILGEQWIARVIQVQNLSTRIRHTVSVRAYIEPITGPGRSCNVEGMTRWGNASGAGASGTGGNAVGHSNDHRHWTWNVAGRINNQTRWIQLKLDTSLKCCEGWCCPNWADRYAVVAFYKTPNIVTRTNNDYILTTAPETIAPGASLDRILDHYLDYKIGDDAVSEAHFRVEYPGARTLTNSIRWWQNWFSGVAPEYSLDRITNSRARDLVEGGLATLKMNECRDGGIVANERGWDMSYVRDGYCGLRGLTAFGHFDESRRFILWLDRNYAAHGLIPDAGPGGSLTYAHPNGNNGKSCPEANAVVEVTALDILAARDYYNGTHDLKTLTSVDRSLSYCMDAQLKYAMTNDYRLEFSGDETELCGASDVAGLRDEGYNRKLAQYWSMTSIALCSASLDFYIQYLKGQGKDPAHYVNRLNGQTLNLYDELGRVQDALERDFWRTNVPNCPQGFHDWFRVKSDGAWPSGRLLNFTLFPVYYGTPMKYPDRAKCDVVAMKQFFNPSIPLLPVTGIAGGKSLGHDLGYLLWGLVAVNDPDKDAVCKALVEGPTAGCWGTYHEAYAGDGTPNKNGLRTFETGVDLSAIGKYWGMGKE